MIKVAVLTVSDSAVAGTREDVSGPALRDECIDLGWQVVWTAIVADEVDRIAAQLRNWVDIGVEFIVTTGGTGVSARDVTPEATRQIIEREIVGMAELMRMKGLEQTPFAPLSRAIVGSYRQTLIVNTPGSPKGAVHSLQAVAHLVPHVVQLLRGHTNHETTRAGDGN